MSAARFDPRDPLVQRTARTLRETQRDPFDYWSHGAAEAADEQALRGTLTQHESPAEARAARAVYWACALGAVASLGVAVFR